MAHSRGKTFLGALFFIIWVFSLVFIKPVTPEILLCLNIPILFIWLGLGQRLGGLSSVISCLYALLFSKTNAYILPVASFIAVSAYAWRCNNILENEIKKAEVNEEKIYEEINLYRNEIKIAQKDNSRMRNSLEMISRLKGIVEKYSQTVSEEDILDSIVNNASELFPDAKRTLLYLVDTEKQELRLVRSRKKESAFPIKAKKGDVFDRWILKHRLPLLVEDIHGDFRFSPEEELDQGFNSLISSPLTAGQKIIGILRVDSPRKGEFTQSDIRFLDIIADLSSVSLQNAILYNKVEDLAIHDSLTGLYVHRYFIERLKNELKRSLKGKTEVSLLMLDLDDFKIQNDKYGHTTGDLVLKHVAAILKSFAEPLDIASRYGGEEFTLLLPNKGIEDALALAEKIRKKIYDTPLVLRRAEIRLSVSVGAASFPSETNADEELLKLVDSRLYRAKQRGKNRVCAC